MRLPARMRFAFATLLMGAACCGGVVWAQRNLPEATQPSPGAKSPFEDGLDRINPKMEAERLRSRNIDRQKRMVDDANRLVLLAAQLRADVEKHGALTEEDQRHLEEIERLARSVKDRMKG